MHIFTLGAVLLATSSFALEDQDDCSINSGGHDIAGESLVQVRTHSKIEAHGQARTNLHGYVEFIQDMAEKVAGHNFTMSDIEKTALTTIKGFIEEMHRSMEVQHAEDQNEVVAIKDLIQDCSSDAAGDLITVGVLKGTMETDRGKHTTCRTTEKSKSGLEKKECADYNMYRKSDAGIPPSCLPNSLAKEWVQTDDSDTLKQMESCLEDTKPWFDPLYSYYQKCLMAGRDHENYTEICNAAQHTFESSFCTYASELDSVCEIQDICHKRHVSSRDDVHSGVELSEAARKADYESSEKITCLFGVFEANNTHKSETLKNCTDLNIDTSKFSITYYNVPGKTACSMESDKPCVSSWVDREYTNADWSSDVDVAECQECVVPVTPAPTPVPTPAPVELVQFDGAVNSNLKVLPGVVGAIDTNSRWNTVAEASRLISRTDGIVGISFQIAAEDSHFLVGLSSATSAIGNYHALNFGLCMRGSYSSTTPETYELASRKQVGTSSKNGNWRTDEYTIKINEDGKSEAALNGVVLYTSSVEVVYPWHVAVDVYQGQSLLSDVRYVTA